CELPPGAVNNQNDPPQCAKAQPRPTVTLVGFSPRMLLVFGSISATLAGVLSKNANMRASPVPVSSPAPGVAPPKFPTTESLSDDVSILAMPCPSYPATYKVSAADPGASETNAMPNVVYPFCPGTYAVAPQLA